MDTIKAVLTHCLGLKLGHGSTVPCLSVNNATIGTAVKAKAHGQK